MDEKNLAIESLFFDYLDKFKFLFFPDKWQIFMDFSKNEIFALFYVYRSSFVNMSEIAGYLNVPLNTATGIIARLEKKELVLRERNKYDKRVVSVSMTEQGKKLIQDEMKDMEFYFGKIITSLSKEETDMVFRIVDKIYDALHIDQDIVKQDEKEKKVKRIKVE